MPSNYLCGINSRFQLLSPTLGQVAYVLLTRSPLTRSKKQAFLILSVRLACIKHAASVHPEPGSNSPFDDSMYLRIYILDLNELTFCLIASYLVFKDRISHRLYEEFSLGAVLYYYNKRYRSCQHFFYTFL